MSRIYKCLQSETARVKSTGYRGSQISYEVPVVLAARAEYVKEPAVPYVRRRENQRNRFPVGRVMQCHCVYCGIIKSLA